MQKDTIKVAQDVDSNHYRGTTYSFLNIVFVPLRIFKLTNEHFMCFSPGPSVTPEKVPSYVV